MLVYIRESDKDKIMCNVDEKDIAEHLRVCVVLHSHSSLGQFPRYHDWKIPSHVSTRGPRPHGSFSYVVIFYNLHIFTMVFPGFLPFNVMDF